MKDHRMKQTLEGIARRGIPENTNVWPALSARLERKSPMSTLRTRPFVAVLLALIILLTLSGVAYAIGRSLGYIPGLGIVDQGLPLRVLAEPITQTRDGITVTVKEAVLGADRTILVVSFDNVPVDKVPNQEDNPDCFPAPALRLREGDPLQPSGSQGNDWGAGSEYHFNYAAVPADMNEAMLFIGCVPGDVSPRVLPEDWEIPLRFIPAPAEMTALPVIEYAPTPVSTGEADANPISITKVIELDDSYILMGKFTIQSNSLGYTLMGMRTLLDDNGNILPWKMPQDSVFPPAAPDGLVTAEDWAVQVDKGFTPPLTIKFSTVSSYPTANDAPLEYEFDAGETPKLGDEWQVNQTFDAAGHSFSLVSIRVDTDENVPGANGYRFTFKPLENAISNIYLDIKGHEFMGYNQNWDQDGMDYFIGYSELPKGKLKISFSLELNDPKEWTLQWQPEDASSNSRLPVEAPQACLTADSWQAALSNPAPIPSSLTGKLVAYGRTVEDGKDPNPDNTGMFVTDLEGSSKQVLGQGMSPALSPDGTRVVYFDSNGLTLVDLVSGATDHIPNTVDGDIFPRWSPDGSRIAFFHSLDSDLYVIHPDGSGLQRALQGIDAEQLTGWTPDSRGLYYYVNTQAGAELRTVEIGSQKVTSLFEHDGYTFFDVSADGGRIPYVSHPNNLYVSNTDGTDRELLASMGNLFISPPVVWSPDGQWLIVNIRKLDDPDIGGAPIPHALINVTSCQIIPIPWSGEIYSWKP
jgi:hypothetical protein